MEPNLVTLRARGIGRFFEAGFLGVWLTGWIAGEAFALAMLGSMLLAVFGLFPDSRITQFGREIREPAAFVLVFLLVWLTGWTFGGVAAWWTFLRRVAGVDRIRIAGSAIDVTRKAGPIRRRRRIERQEIRRIRMQRRDGSLVADTRTGTHVLSDLGTLAERESLSSWIRSQLQLSDTPAPVDPAAAPAGWTLAPPDANGAPRLTRPRGGRTAVGAALWIITGVILYAAVQTEPPHPWLTMLFVALLAFASAWVCWAREEWLIQHQRLEYRLQLGPFLKVRTFDDGYLELAHSTDSDGDDRYRLLVRDATKKKVIDSAFHDDTTLQDLARWLETSTKLTLKAS